VGDSSGPVVRKTIWGRAIKKRTIAKSGYLSLNCAPEGAWGGVGTGTDSLQTLGIGGNWEV